MARKMNEMNTANIAMEKNLTAHGMGLPEMVSEVDALVFEDEEILVGRWNAKSTRKDRFKATDLHARKLAKKAICRTGKEVFVATHVGKDGIAKGHKVTWHSNCGKGKKAWTKKFRRNKPAVINTDTDSVIDWIQHRHNAENPYETIEVLGYYREGTNVTYCGWITTEYFGEMYREYTMPWDNSIEDEIRTWIADGEPAELTEEHDTQEWNYHTPELATTIADSTGFLTEWKTLKFEELAQAKLDAITAMEEAKLAYLKLKVAEEKLEIAKLRAELAE